jgi:hypothetical protein
MLYIYFWILIYPNKNGWNDSVLIPLTDPVIDKLPVIWCTFDIDDPNLLLPATSNFAAGLVVPIPTLPLLSTFILWFPWPSASIILLDIDVDNPVTFATSIESK